MLDLNDAAAIHAADSHNLLDQILNLPQDLEDGWRVAQSLELPESFARIDRVVLAGVGDAIEGGALFAALIASECPIPIVTARDYDLPAFASGLNTLVIATADESDSAETRSMFEQARTRQCQLLALAVKGKLADRTRQLGVPHLDAGDRAPIGWTLAALLNIASRLQWTHDFADDLAEAVDVTQTWSRALGAESPVAQNLAKREAGQLMGRMVTVYGAGHLAAVARHWKNRLNLVAKTWAAFEVIPEANHNALAGTDWPADLPRQVMALFLTSASDHPLNAQRLAVTQRAFMLHGCNTDILRARGRSPLAQAMAMALLGDCLSFYLALLYGADPEQTSAITEFNAEMGEA